MGKRASELENQYTYLIRRVIVFATLKVMFSPTTFQE